MSDLEETAKYLKRKIRATSIDVHPVEEALLVQYELEAQILGEDGDPMLGDRKQYQKIIRVKSLTGETDIDSLAEEIISKCNLIHPSRSGEVKQLLYYLQRRKLTSQSQAKQGEVKKAKSPSLWSETSPYNELQETANLTELDNYIELLYEDVPQKTQGSGLILQLMRNPDNLEEFSENEVLIVALARILREDWKKSIDLTTNLVYCFYCFSVFSQFHHVIQENKVGSLVMDIITWELQRRELWSQELDAEDSAKKDVTHAKKVMALLKKQNQLLRVSFYLLLNLSEDLKIEQKMYSKNICGLLTQSLDLHASCPLVTLILTFLQKLSIYKENKDKMVSCGAIEKVMEIMECCDNPEDDVINLSIRLLFNLSFDTAVRNQMVHLGVLPKLVYFLGVSSHQHQVICLLYHLSMDDRCKSLFSYTDTISKLMAMVVESGEEQVDIELMALCINLAANKQCAQQMCEGGRFKSLMEMTLKNQDPLSMKLLRNISQHQGSSRELFLNYVDKLTKLLRGSQNDDFVIECIGTLGNLDGVGIKWGELLNQHDLWNWIQRCISGKERCEDDVLLEIVILLGTVIIDDEAAAILLKSHLMKDIIDLLNAKQEDDEVVLQIMYLLQQLLANSEIRTEVITRYPEAVHYLVDLMHDANSEISKLCDSTLDVVAEAKFKHHNAQWLEMVAGTTKQYVGDDTSSLDDSLGAYDAETNLLDRAQLFNSTTSDDALSSENEDNPSSPSGR